MATEPSLFFPPPRIFLRADPSVTIAQPALGLTLYLDDPAAWAWEGAAEALKAFLARVPNEDLRWYTTSTLPEWRPAASEGPG